MANYDEIARHALDLHKAMLANPAYSFKPLDEIANDAILTSESIHTVLEARGQLAAMLEEVAQRQARDKDAGKGVLRWLFGDGTDMPDHLG